MTEIRDSGGRFAPGSKCGGRRAGIPNKTTREVKAMLEQAFDGVGGLEALIAWAKEKPDLFYPIWAKLLPLSVKADVSGNFVDILEAARQRV